MRRGYQLGFGRWSLAADTRLPHDYDWTFDTERMTTRQCAAAVLANRPNAG